MRLPNEVNIQKDWLNLMFGEVSGGGRDSFSVLGAIADGLRYRVQVRRYFGAPVARCVHEEFTAKNSRYRSEINTMIWHLAFHIWTASSNRLHPEASYRLWASVPGSVATQEEAPHAKGLDQHSSTARLAAAARASAQPIRAKLFTYLNLKAHPQNQFCPALDHVQTTCVLFQQYPYKR